MSAKLWQQMTDEQVEQVRARTISLKVDREGMVHALRHTDGRRGVGLTPRRAIEGMSALETA